MDIRMIRTHRDLIAWQLGMRLAKNTYEITQSMPKTEQFGLTSQMRRAAVSIPSNIAEGYARQSRVDYIKFLKIARGSLAELSTQYELSIDLKLLDLGEHGHQVLRKFLRQRQLHRRRIERLGHRRADIVVDGDGDALGGREVGIAQGET